MLCVQHVGVKNDLAVDVAGGAAGRLDEAGGAAQIALLVGVQNGHQRDFGQVQPLAQEIDADQDVEIALAQGAQDFDPFDGVNLAVQIADVDAQVAQIIGQFLGRFFGQGRDQRALLFGGALANLLHQVVNLPRQRFEGDLRVHQAGGADDLLDDAAQRTSPAPCCCGVALR